MHKFSIINITIRSTVAFSKFPTIAAFIITSLTSSSIVCLISISGRSWLWLLLLFAALSGVEFIWSSSLSTTEWALFTIRMEILWWITLKSSFKLSSDIFELAGMTLIFSSLLLSFFSEFFRRIWEFSPTIKFSKCDPAYITHFGMIMQFFIVQSAWIWTSWKTMLESILQSESIATFFPKCMCPERATDFSILAEVSIAWRKSLVLTKSLSLI